MVRRLRIAAPMLIAVATFLAFLPVLRNGFVDFDDPVLLLNNPFYRGLGWTQLKWMFGAAAASLSNHYIPLTWLTFGLDYVLWGMAPFGYHLTTLLLHSANAALFFFISRRLLALALPGDGEPDGAELDLAAAFAALFFSLHPLRVESVAWATERRDVLSGLFYLVTLLSYLRSCSAEAGTPRRLWLCASIASFALGLVSKVSGLAVPVVLVVLDLYPLRRLPGDPRQWACPQARPVWLEKAPFFLLSAAAAVAGMYFAKPYVLSLADVRGGERVALAVFGPAFYLWKTIVPVHLLVMYDRPRPIHPFAWTFVVSGVLVAASSAVGYVWRRRSPAAFAVWASYLLMLGPVIGVIANGDQLAADRYTYLPCLGWAVLGAGFLKAARWPAARWRFAVGTGVLALLAALTWRQTKVWHDSETLWRHVLSIRPDTVVAHNNLGMELYSRGRTAEAVAEFKEALRVRPSYAYAQNNLGIALRILGKTAEAISHYREALRLKPDYLEAHTNLAEALAALGRNDEAIVHLVEALRLKPDSAEPHYRLGNQLYQRGRVAEAAEQFRLAVQLKPDYAEARGALAAALSRQRLEKDAVARLEETVRLQPRSAPAHYNLGLRYHQSGRLAEAIAQYREALRIRPDDPDAHNNLGVALLSVGRAAEAVDHQRLALRANPNYPSAHFNMGLALERLGKTAEAMAQYEQALKLNPDYAEAQFGLGTCLDALNRRAEALAHYRAALRINPGFAPARERAERHQRAPAPDR